ncbi:PAS domain-containing sensor histidine kinase [Candidatus Parcubacteria bacterium]|nr:PAS domain-containing sensor histidine kinase [Candidatus Parcubacteria bacterium]
MLTETNLYAFSLVIFFSLFIYVVVEARSEQKRFANLKLDYLKKQEYLSRKLYEISVLSQISERIGYSLSVQNIIDIIISSLGDLVGYTSVSYLYESDGKFNLKISLEESVGKKYLSEVKKNLLVAFFALNKIKLKNIAPDIETTITGAVISESQEVPSSFFNVPIFKKGRGVGLINISSLHFNLYTKDESVNTIFEIAKRASMALTKLSNLLDTEEQKLKSSVESLKDGVVFFDKDLKIIVINEAFQKMLGLKNANCNFYDVISKFPREINLKGAFDEATKLNKVTIFNEVYLKNKVVRLTVIPILDGAQIIGCAFSLQDITREMELVKMREDFTSMMIHDLRSPLTVIRGTSDLIEKRAKEISQEKKTELLWQIKDSAGSMLDIVNDLLDVAKLESGKFRLEKSHCNLTELINQKVVPYQNVMIGKNVKLTTKMPKTPVFIECDTEKIGRVVINLLSNAIKYTKDGSVTVSLTTSKSRATVAVKDTGVGISKSQIPLLFNKFQQLRAPVDPMQKGTGLGLVIAKGIIESHGGQIKVTSEEQKGSTFSFTLLLK